VIVFATDAVVQVFAMMVKVLDAPFASFAVIAFGVHSAFTLVAVRYLSEFIVFLHFENQIVNWIGTSQECVIVGNEEHESVGDSY
jgi:CO/xanthine dehydrogenase Mo-binding subunit